MSELKAAVIGVGSMGQNHARVYSEIAPTRLVAVSDTSEHTAGNVAAKYGVPAFTDYRDLLNDMKPDVVTVAVPTSLHKEVAEAAMDSGAHILVEKPITSTVADGRALIKRARALNRQLMIGHIVRFNPAIQDLKQRLDDGELGRIFQIVCRRTGPFPSRIRDVGVVVDLAPHDLDVMLFVSGDKPVRVYAETEQQIHTAHEDSLAAILRFRSGFTGILETNWLTPTKVREVVVLGERGMFRVDDLTQDLYFYENSQANGEIWDTLQLLRGVSEGKMVRYNLKRYEPLKAELEAFANAVIDGRPVPVSGEDGLAALRLALALIESSREHKAIEISE